MRVSKLSLSDNIIMQSVPFKEKRKENKNIPCEYNGTNKTSNTYRPAKRVSLSGSELSRANNKDNISFTGKEKIVRTTAEMVKDFSKEAIHKGAVQDIPAWADKMGGAKWFSGVLDSVNKNEAFYEAVTALVVAGILKPVCVLAMPGAEMEDKQMSATKNAVSAFIGFGLSNLILSPFSSGVNKVMKSLDSGNPTKYIKDMNYVNALNNEELIELASGTKLKSTLKDSFKTTYKKLPDLGVSPMKAALTIAITPYVLNLLFGKDKKDKNKKPADNPMDKMTVMNLIRAENNKKTSSPSFGEKIQNKTNSSDSTGKADNTAVSFTGNYNLCDTKNSASFTGGVNQVIEIAKDTGKKAGKKGLNNVKQTYNGLFDEWIAKAIGWFSPTKAGQKLVETTARFEKPSARWSDLASFAITYFYVRNTAKSEKIEEDRKLPLMINNVMVTAASSTAAFLIDKCTDKPMEELLRSYLKHNNADIHNKANENIVKTLKTALEDGVDKTSIDGLKKHSEDLLSGGMDDISENLKNSIKALNNNEIVQRAIKEKIIDKDDIAKMAASGFEKQAKSIYGNISKAKSLTVFTLTVRFLVTVLMTPVIGRVVALVNKKLGKDKENENKKPDANVPLPGSETFGMKDYMSWLSSEK